MKQTYTFRNGHSLLYELTRKNVKNINLRIKSDGSVYISAPAYVPLSLIHAFLEEKQTFIDKALQTLASRANEAPAPLPGLQPGSTVWLLGEPYTAIFEKAPLHEAVGKREHTLVFSLRDTTNRQHADYLLEACRGKMLAPLIDSFCREIYAKASVKKKFPYPKVTLRSMRSRWGSCNPYQSKLTFNTRLIHVPPACIEYVVYHEFSHYFEQNHSPAFYAVLSEFCPDWQVQRDALKEFARRYRVLE